MVFLQGAQLGAAACVVQFLSGKKGAVQVVAAGAAREGPEWAGEAPYVFYCIAIFDAFGQAAGAGIRYANGFTIRTPSITWPSFISSVSSTEHPPCLAMRNTSASQYEI